MLTPARPIALVLVLACIVPEPGAAQRPGSSAATTWIVDNHERRAGALTVEQRGDTTVARWIYTDRNRGGRVETRTVRGLDGAVWVTRLPR